ncbi:MAG TPA: BMP family ABC transporter substrate-binding protein [Flexilinea sp.]|jgi:basic membrane protein A|nr:BMP family ABC transporter substrate-binding protein [Flexilinea sp.]HQG88816.1 BMP family ABC transporter substrate-binding protein [Flexilinea sp.]
MSKKLFSVMLAIAVVFSIFGIVAAEDAPIKVVLLINGSLGDKGFYDSAASGVRRMEKELGAQTKIIEMGRDETAYEGHYLDVSEQDWDLIISGTWSVKELAQNIAVQFPEKHYIFFDGNVDRTVVTTGNMLGISYLDNEGSFMAGALAALMLDSGAEKIDPDKRILGFVGSMDTANINNFLVGYIEGIKYIDPSIKLLTSYVGSFEDVPKALEMTTQLYNQGAQIVFAPASQSILGAVTASSNVDKYFIGCDMDTWAQLQDTDANLARNIISSALKNVGDSLVTAVKGYMDGTMDTSHDYSLGLSTGAVGLAKNDNYKALVPEEIQKKLDEIEKKIIDGEIVVGSAFGMKSEDVAALRDAMKP